MDYQLEKHLHKAIAELQSAKLYSGYIGFKVDIKEVIEMIGKIQDKLEKKRIKNIKT